MFDKDEVERVIALQQKSYNLLKWAGDSLQRGALSFTKVHSALSLSDAAREWITLHLAGIPADARPAIEDLEAFSHLFVSFLTTSFELVETPGTRKVSDYGCYCRYCSYLSAANHLKVRQPGKKAKEQATAIKDLFLASAAAEAGVALTKSLRDSVTADSGLAEDLAYAAYMRELIRRSEFASQGEGVLVLWRQIAWDSRGKLKKGFQLSADRALRADTNVVEALRRSSAHVRSAASARIFWP